MDTSPIIKIKDLDVIYFLGKSNEVKALQDINIDIYPEEFIIFFGPSGCGKSTLLYSIAGLETNIQGDIYIDERNIAELKAKDLEYLHQKKTGMIFQAYHLINSLSVMKNVILPQIFMGGDRKKRQNKAMELLDHFGVGVQADKLPSELSGGQQQRVAIARSLINDPDILLADEPVGNLDSHSANDVMHLLFDLNRKFKKTIILVTHNPAFLNFAHRVFYMKDGKVIETKVNEAVDQVVDLLEIGPDFTAEGTGDKSKKDKNKKDEETGEDEDSVMSGSKISRELELLAKTYSSVTDNQFGNLLIPFKAKEIVAEVLTGLTSEEIEEIEKRVEKLLVSEIEDKDLILEYLDKDEKEGGLGANKKTAENFAERIKGIVGEIKFMKKKGKKQDAKKPSRSEEEITKVRHYLLDSFDVKIKKVKSIKVMNQAITDRLLDKIDGTEFQNILDLPLDKNGAGLDKRTAKKLTQRLELLILGKFE